MRSAIKAIFAAGNQRFLAISLSSSMLGLVVLPSDAVADIAGHGAAVGVTRTDGDYASGYQQGFEDGRSNAGWSCSRLPRGYRPPGWGERARDATAYQRGYWDGFEHGYNAICP